MNDFQYSVQQRDDYPNAFTQYGWVLKTYGKETRGVRWGHRRGCYFFKDEKDLTLFLIRWPQ